MRREFTINKIPAIIVVIKIIFSKPLRDLYILKELLSVDDKPDDLDWIKTKTIRRVETINWDIFTNLIIFIFSLNKDPPKTNTRY